MKIIVCCVDLDRFKLEVGSLMYRAATIVSLENIRAVLVCAKKLTVFSVEKENIKVSGVPPVQINAYRALLAHIRVPVALQTLVLVLCVNLASIQQLLVFLQNMTVHKMELSLIASKVK